jgi:hypothetical protein
MADRQPDKDRRPEGEEGAGAHQEGPNSIQAGHTNATSAARRRTKDWSIYKARKQALSGRYAERKQSLVGPM